MVSWTTNVAEIAPAVATLGRPLRLLRIPIDEWAVALALALRAFPMLIDEFRVLYAARRLRPKPVAPPVGPAAGVGRSELVDLLAAAITVTLRRADEMGDAITARGGTGQISAVPSRPKRADWVALSIIVARVLRRAGYARSCDACGQPGRASGARRRWPRPAPGAGVVATSLRPRNISSKYGLIA